MRVTRDDHLTILILDAQAVTRQGVKQFLSVTLTSTTALDFADMSEVASEICDLDVIVLNHATTAEACLETLRALKLRWPAAPVLILSLQSDSELARRALIVGANGFLTKGSSAHDWLEAILTVAGGGTYVSPDIGR